MKTPALGAISMLSPMLKATVEGTNPVTTIELPPVIGPFVTVPPNLKPEGGEPPASPAPDI